MPNGEVHAGITLAAASLIYIWGMKSGEAPVLAAAAAVGTAAGVLVNPDLDVEGTRADRIVRGLGLAPAIIWGVLWRPYSRLIPHRSMLSHGPVIGTALRLVYMAAPFWLLGILPQMTPGLARAIMGLVIADNLHIGLDFIITGVEKNAERNQRF